MDTFTERTTSVDAPLYLLNGLLPFDLVNSVLLDFFSKVKIVDVKRRFNGEMVKRTISSDRKSEVWDYSWGQLFRINIWDKNERIEQLKSFHNGKMVAWWIFNRITGETEYIEYFTNGRIKFKEMEDRRQNIKQIAEFFYNGNLRRRLLQNTS